MSFDGMVTNAVAIEINGLLTGGKIEKIYQPEQDELIFHIHGNREHYKLYLSSNSGHARMHLITTSGSNPQHPMAFCMLLRKHLQGGRITSILQRDTERIIELSIDTINELGFSVNKKLIVEIMGKHSNIILIDAVSGKIIDSIKRISIDVNRYRQLLPGQIYVYPPTQGKIPYHHLSLPAFMDAMANTQGDPSRGLVSSIQGISPILAEEIAKEAADDHLEGVYHAFFAMVEKIQTGSFIPRVYVDEKEVPVDFHLFPLSSLQGQYRELTFEGISSAAEYFYSHKNSSNRIRQKSADLERAVANSLDKLYLKKQRLCEDIQRAEQSKEDKLYGELLTASLHTVTQGAKSAELLNYYDQTTITVPLDPRLSPVQNAQKYYKKYAKAKTATIEKNIQLKETDQDISYLESVLAYVEQASSVEEIEDLRQELVEIGYLKKRKNQYKPAKTKASPITYQTSDGFQVLVGRNNKENDLLTFKRASAKDLWFHAKDIPGSHVILMTEGKSITETSILEAAGFAAYHSKGKTSENVPVDYTQVRHVKKPSGAKPGMVIFTNNKTVYVNPLIQ